MYRVLLPVDRDAERSYHQAKYVERLANDGADVEVTVLHVVPPDGSDQADEVVVGGRKRSGVSQVLLGSITQDVVLSAERPVTVTG